MTTRELHEILDNKNRKLSLAELKQVIYELKQDCFNQTNDLLEETAKGEVEREEYVHKNGFYDGEQNAFQIVLDLLEHLEENEYK